MKAIKVIIKIGKIILGAVLGLFTSFLIIVLLDAILDNPNPFSKYSPNLWAIGIVIIMCEFLFLWLFLRNGSGKNLHTENIEHLPGSIAELIDAIIDSMGYRRNARAEVRQELTDHFTDALADCYNEPEKLACIKELINEFGDAKLLGALLRRGKKRCRPLWQKTLSGLRHAIWISVVLLILYIGWFFTGTPDISTNYLTVFNEQARPAVDESLNAWPYYEKAYKSYVDCNDKEFDSYPRLASQLSQTDRQTLMKWLDNNRPALELIVTGNQKPYCWRQYGCDENESTELISILMPGLSDVKKLSYLMCWQALAEAEENQFDAAFNNILESYSLGQHIRGQHSTLIEQLVSISVESTSIHTLRTLLNEYSDSITTGQLDTARKRFAEMINNYDYTIDFDSEKLFLYDEAQRCFTQSRFGKSHLYLRRLQDIGIGNLNNDELLTEDPIVIGKAALHVLFTHPDKDETLKQVEAFYADMEYFSTLTPATAQSQDLDMHQQLEQLIQNNFFLNGLMPALSKVVLYSHRSKTDAEASLTLMAILQYQKQFGDFPQKLDDLVAKGLLQTIPIDPFSDRRLVYRKIDNDFFLYSFGYNLTDDGGTPGTYEGTNKNPIVKLWTNNGDAVFWPISVNSEQ